MSERADLDRTMRQMWAASGSSHDRLVRILRFGLPLVIGVVAAVLAHEAGVQPAGGRGGGGVAVVEQGEAGHGERLSSSRPCRA